MHLFATVVIQRRLFVKQITGSAKKGGLSDPLAGRCKRGGGDANIPTPLLTSPPPPRWLPHPLTQIAPSTNPHSPKRRHCLRILSFTTHQSFLTTQSRS